MWRPKCVGPSARRLTAGGRGAVPPPPRSTGWVRAPTIGAVTAPMNASFHDRQRRLQERMVVTVGDLLARLVPDAAFALLGSMVVGRNDAYSDIDLRVVFPDDRRAGAEALRAAVRASETCLAHLWVYDRHALYLFASGVRLDLDLLGPADQTAGAPVGPIRVLRDPAGILAAGAEGPRPPVAHPPHFGPSRDYLEWFFWMFRQTAGWALGATRGDGRSFDKLAAAIDSLAQARAGLVAMWQWVRQQEGYLGALDPAFAAALARTYPRCAAAEVVACNRALFGLFGRLAPEYAARAGVEIPAGDLAALAGILTAMEG